jgi:ABC-type cobalamin/Fe3+-siderophores transport system ATPase subunit
MYCTGTPQEVLTIENMKNLFRVKSQIIEIPGETPYIRYLGSDIS